MLLDALSNTAIKTEVQVERDVLAALRSGANPDSVPGIMDDFGNQFNPLFEAIVAGFPRVVGLLLNYGASLQSRGKSAIHTAAEFDATGTIMPLLLAAGEIRDIINTPLVIGGAGPANTPLHIAMTSGTSAPSVVKDLLKAGADPNIPNSDGETAMQLASRMAANSVINAKIVILQGSVQGITSLLAGGRRRRTRHRRRKNSRKH